MNTMKNRIPSANPVAVDRTGFVEIVGPSRFTTDIEINPALKNSRGSPTTTNRVLLLDNPNIESSVVSIPGFL